MGLSRDKSTTKHIGKTIWLGRDTSCRILLCSSWGILYWALAEHWQSIETPRMCKWVRHTDNSTQNTRSSAVSFQPQPLPLKPTSLAFVGREKCCHCVVFSPSFVSCGIHVEKHPASNEPCSLDSYHSPVWRKTWSLWNIMKCCGMLWYVAIILWSTMSQYAI